jgi:hypothetical protein
MDIRTAVQKSGVYSALMQKEYLLVLSPHQWYHMTDSVMNCHSTNPGRPLYAACRSNRILAGQILQHICEPKSRHVEAAKAEPEFSSAGITIRQLFPSFLDNVPSLGSESGLIPFSKVDSLPSGQYSLFLEGRQVYIYEGVAVLRPGLWYHTRAHGTDLGETSPGIANSCMRECSLKRMGGVHPQLVRRLGKRPMPHGSRLLLLP